MKKEMVKAVTTVQTLSHKLRLIIAKVMLFLSGVNTLLNVKMARM